MKKRDLYLNQLVKYQDKPLIKVITGMRRCGKSTLLLLFEQHLISSGVAGDNIISINFESYEYSKINNQDDLHRLIIDRVVDKQKKHYVLLDEIQLVNSWERVINSLMIDMNADIYITGSNAHLLSSELSTLLSGRYVEIKMLPLAFCEYIDFTQADRYSGLENAFNNYLRYGGLPTVVELLNSPETIGPYLEGIYNTVLVKDVIVRNSVRDAALLEGILRFISANIGNIVSTKKISDYLNSAGRKTTSDTIDNYLRMLEKAYIIYKADRYDIKGKMYLKTLEKYYIADIGIRNQLIGKHDTDYGAILENIVYLELIRRGYDVKIGKAGTKQVDFIAVKPDETIYYQVSATILSQETRERELRSLQAISDNYPKYILTMDKTVFDDFSGIRVKNIIDFLME